MRILYLSHLIPWPLDAGPKVRSYFVLRHLAEAGHEITLLAFSRESDTAESIDRVRQFCTAVYTVPMKRSRVRDAWHFGRRLLTGIPFLIARDSVAEMTSMAGRLAASGGVDAIHADQLWMAQYALSAVPRPCPIKRRSSYWTNIMPCFLSRSDWLRARLARSNAPCCAVKLA